MNNPPLKVYKAAKELSEDFCKIAGAHAADGTLAMTLVRITDGYESNLNAYRNWIKNVFAVEYDVNEKRGSNEWVVEFHSGIIARYLNKILDFPSGTKQYSVSEPEMIRRASLNFRKSFALGALTFESGVGVKHQVELCVSSKDFRDSISKILTLFDLRHIAMKNISGDYWRLWSNKLSKEDAKKWMEFYEPQTEKWFLLNDYIDGYKGAAVSFDDALKKLNNVYPSKSGSKVCLKDVLIAISDLKRTYRYEIISYLCKQKGLDSYGGKWAHSLMYYLNILRGANMINIIKEEFGKKKSFGSIVREVYIYNLKVNEWRIPIR